MKPVGDILDGITDPGLRERAASLRAAMERNPRRDLQDEPKPQTAKIIQLPLWPEPKRGVPNSALRGALFAAIQGKNRRWMEGELLFVQQGIEIRFTGKQLDQSDLDVWEQALHLARQHPLGTQCHFTAHGFLKALGRRTSGSDHEWLKDVFRRLMACGVEITHNRMTYGGSLLEFFRDEDSGQYVLEINPKIIALYTAGWTATDWDQRQLLRGKPLALWLHGFYSSHANPHPMKLETLMQLSGGSNKTHRSYTQKIKKAHEALLEAGVIRGFEIKDGLVTVDNVPSRSQQKHLRKARPCRKKQARDTGCTGT